MQNSTWVWIVVLIVVLGGGFYWYSMSDTDAVDQGANSNAIGNTVDVTTPNESGSNVDTGVEVSVDAPVVVTFTDSGVSPSTVTIKKGQTVKFVNNSSRAVWPASDEHPSHTKYSGTSRTDHCPDTTNTTFDACRGLEKGESWEFTFAKAGSWDWHDHLRASVGGVVTVQ